MWSSRPLLPERVKVSLTWLISERVQVLRACLALTSEPRSSVLERAPRAGPRGRGRAVRWTTYETALIVRFNECRYTLPTASTADEQFNPPPPQAAPASCGGNGHAKRLVVAAAQSGEAVPTSLTHCALLR